MSYLLEAFHDSANAESYNYLGVTSYSSGSFDLTAAEFVKKGLMAEGAIFSSLKNTRLFSLGNHGKLNDSIVKSTTL